jgi:hypothetical protein
MLAINLNYNKTKLSQLKNEYFMAKALMETIQETAYEIEKRILEENEFYECIEGEMKEAYQKGGWDTTPKRITNPDEAYMMVEEQFNKYLDLCYEGYVKAGIDNPKGRGWCPDADAKDLYWKARKQLVNYAIDIIPDGYSEKDILKKAVQNIKWSDRVLDLVLRLEC